MAYKRKNWQKILLCLRKENSKIFQKKKKIIKIKKNFSCMSIFFRLSLLLWFFFFWICYLSTEQLSCHNFDHLFYDKMCLQKFLWIVSHMSKSRSKIVSLKKKEFSFSTIIFFYGVLIIYSNSSKDIIVNSNAKTKFNTNTKVWTFLTLLSKKWNNNC